LDSSDTVQASSDMGPEQLRALLVGTGVGSSSGARERVADVAFTRFVPAAASVAVRPRCVCTQLQLGIYVLFTALGAASLWQQPWVLDTQQLWAGWPHHDFT
jgi:hypothetical protein